MGGISNDNIIKFILGISGLGLSLASFTLSRVFSLEEYTHAVSEKLHEQEVRVEYASQIAAKIDEIQRTRAERVATLEAKLLIFEETVKDLKSQKKNNNES